MLPRTKPYVMLCYEALFRWLQPHLRENKILQEEYANYRAGYMGEKNADYIVMSYPHKNAYFFQGIRLKLGPYHFQIDTLMITPAFILIIEIKNLRGELLYNPSTQQLIQIDGDQKKSQKNPILQAEAQKRQLMLWLQHFGIPPIPIETISVSANPSSIITYSDDTFTPKKFIQVESLPTLFDTLYQTYTKKVYDPVSMQNLNRKLLSENTQYKPDLIRQFDISERHLVKGLVCMNCNRYPLEYKFRKWKCKYCGKIDTDSYKQKIFDYFLLFEPTITNRVCREILQISSPKTARHLLYSLNLKYTGKNYARKYHSPSLEEFPQDSYVPIRKRSIFHDY